MTSAPRAPEAAEAPRLRLSIAAPLQSGVAKLFSARAPASRIRPKGYLLSLFAFPGVQMKIDMHIHSDRSDGIHSPATLVDMAAEHGLSAISLTDHDSLDGVEECMQEAERKGLEALSGVELSAEVDGRDFHVLGYGIDSKDGKLQDMLQQFRDTRLRRGHKILEKLKALGIDLDADQVIASSPEGALGRPHIAKALLKQGFVKSYQEAFDRFIADGGPAYVKKFKLDPTDAVDYIHSAGGLAFIAHPGTFIRSPGELVELLDLPFDGIEVAHPHHSDGQREKYESIAAEHGLLASGGSDYHGFAGKDTPLGVPEVPYVYFEKIKERLETLHK
jgi:predicted metal-dependent phosphoesterase TrpH